MKNSTIALITTGVLATVGVGVLFYFDYRRRNDPTFRKHLRRERKNAAKAAKEAEKHAEESRLKMIENVIIESSKEEYPTTPEAREKYFMEQIAAGEALCGKGPTAYDDAVVFFYKALKVYPAPMELIQIYQKTIPEPVFQLITTIYAIEQKAMEGQLNETPEAAAAAATGI
ncbi:mitochondrial outer membrane translocase complex, subunit Tom20 domain-containing protein [Mycotypha africana]|uniref:mitochondrial outer membrane translocase complex, subunit Tom20 domain-containing protein n=1 Tax=Mycotypha africana TaxID=64632 RepID=UPI002300DDF9|nr:mitochondrial outer membrane translocase complex, subunit Tom20 domain-containing protein [Mycotypha africana]KAI8991850.1 mitochondrial outer membrane translocase complex, subunit Tom20 domain-containing protein [Mycotypha africana]